MAKSHKTPKNLTLQHFKVVVGVNRKCLCDLLLVVITDTAVSSMGRRRNRTLLSTCDDDDDRTCTDIVTWFASSHSLTSILLINVSIQN